MQTVLLMEDDAEVREAIVETLGSSFQIIPCENAAQGLARMESGGIDAILLDVRLGQDDGFEFCARIKTSPAWAEIPVVFLSGLDDEAARLRGFDVGGDDYVAKPFSPAELIARLKARTRRSATARRQFGPIRVSWEMQKAFIDGAEGERDALLTPLEFRILACLCRSPGQVVSRARLIDEAWGKGIHIGARSVDKHVCLLRQKLGPSATAIGTKPGTGYIFTPDPS